jgi:hypothetical protein
VIGMWLLVACAPEQEPAPVSEPCTACEGACTADTTTPTSAAHTTADMDYAISPPSGGDHDPCWAEWGVHAAEIRPENWLHNAEHGGVIVLYRTGSPQADVDALVAWVEAQPPGRALLTPYSDPMERAYAAVMWGARLQTDCVDTAALDAFFAVNAGGAPEDTISDPPSTCWDTASGGETGTMAR